MVGSDAASRYLKRRCFVVRSFQVSKHAVEDHPDQAKHILSNDPSGPEFLHNAEHFRPEETVISLASTEPGLTKRLTGKPATDNVNC